MAIINILQSMSGENLSLGINISHLILKESFKARYLPVSDRFGI